MTIAMQPIYTQTVGATSVSNITFNNIPQTFTDLQVVISARSSVGGVDEGIIAQLNNDTGSNYSYTALFGSGGLGTGSFRDTSVTFARIGYCSGIGATANTFGSNGAYFTNYTSSNFKSWIVDALNENNAANTTFQTLVASLWRSTAAITSIKIIPQSGNNFLQYSTFTLYGITRG